MILNTGSLSKEEDICCVRGRDRRRGIGSLGLALARRRPGAGHSSDFRGIQVGRATFTSLESGILVAGTSALNFAIAGVVFEGGVLAGSMVSAIRTGSGDTVSDLLTNWLFKELGPDTSNIPELSCGW